MWQSSPVTVHSCFSSASEVKFQTINWFPSCFKKSTSLFSIISNNGWINSRFMIIKQNKEIHCPREARETPSSLHNIVIQRIFGTKLGSGEDPGLFPTGVSTGVGGTRGSVFLGGNKDSVQVFVHTRLRRYVWDSPGNGCVRAAVLKNCKPLLILPWGFCWLGLRALRGIFPCSLLGAGKPVRNLPEVGQLLFFFFF